MTYYDEDFIRQDLKARFKRVSQLSRFRHSYSKWEQLEIYIRHLEVMYDISHNYLWLDIQSTSIPQNFPDSLSEDYFRLLENCLFNAIERTVKRQVEYLLKYAELSERLEREGLLILPSQYITTIKPHNP